MQSAELTEFLNRYFDALFRPVGLHGGFVSDVVGDAMLALWPGPSKDKHAAMLAALLQMRDAARHFNETFARHRLMTRFGVDWGPITLATVGAHRHYEYRAVGDTVNTASRIQELNKKLGTSVLLSKRSIGPGTEQFLIRDIGAFLLRGKSIAVDICELVDERSNATTGQLDLCARFGECVELARRDATAAIAAFQRLLIDHPGDGPSAFYLQALRAGHAPISNAFRVG
jgi:adenylate cyclase